MWQARQAYTHYRVYKPARLLGAAQTRGSPPRCGDGYAALPLFH